MCIRDRSSVGCGQGGHGVVTVPGEAEGRSLRTSMTGVAARSKSRQLVAVLVAVRHQNQPPAPIRLYPRSALTSPNASTDTRPRPLQGILKACWVKALGGSNPPSSAGAKGPRPAVTWRRDL